MTEPNFRALCAELLTAVDGKNCFIDGSSVEAIDHLTTIFDRIEIALATPPPEPPTDEELVKLRNRVIADWCSSRSNNGANLLSDDDLVVCQAAGLRAALERWGK